MQPIPFNIVLVYTGKEGKSEGKAVLKMATMLAVVRMMMNSLPLPKVLKGTAHYLCSCIVNM